MTLRILNPSCSLDDFFALLRKGPSLLLLDYDGTLAPFNPDPKKAWPYPGVMEKIQKIIAQGHSKVVIISGRELNSLVQFIPIDPLPELWGCHGAERRTSDGQYSLIEINEDQAIGLKKARERGFVELPPERCEIKPTSIAIHWRGMENTAKEKLEKDIQREWKEIANQHHLEVHAFDGGLEMRVREISKRRPVDTLLGEMSEVGAIAYLGDDATDEDAFAALGSRGLKVLVRSEWRPTGADIQIRPPEELLEFFDRWAQV